MQLRFSLLWLLVISPAVLTFKPDLEAGVPIERSLPAQPSDVPWHAGIYKPEGENYTLICGGTLITSNVILTSAHCFWDKPSKKQHPEVLQFKVTFGKVLSDWPEELSDTSVQRRGIVKTMLFTRYRGYDVRYLEYDVALGVLTSPVVQSDKVKVVAIDFDRYEPIIGSVGRIAEWGYNVDGNRSRELRSVTLPYVSHDNCYAALKTVRFKQLLTSDKYCTGFIDQSKRVCLGDTGSGFVVRDRITGEDFVRGMAVHDFRPASFKGICYPYHFTAFTNIQESRYLQWVQTQLATVAAPDN